MDSTVKLSKEKIFHLKMLLLIERLLSIYLRQDHLTFSDNNLHQFLSCKHISVFMLLILLCTTFSLLHVNDCSMQWIQSYIPILLPTQIGQSVQDSRGSIIQKLCLGNSQITLKSKKQQTVGHSRTNTQYDSIVLLHIRSYGWTRFSIILRLQTYSKY